MDPATAGQSLGCHPFTSSHLPLPRNHRRPDALPAMIKLDSPGFGWIYLDHPESTSFSIFQRAFQGGAGGRSRKGASHFPLPRPDLVGFTWIRPSSLKPAGASRHRSPFGMSPPLMRTAWISLDQLGFPVSRRFFHIPFSIFHCPPGFGRIYLDPALLTQAGPRFPTTRAPFS